MSYENIPKNANETAVLNEVANFPLTAFGDLRVASLSPILQISFEYTVTNEEIGTIELLGSGAVTQADAMCVVSTGTTTGSTAEWETKKHAKYRAGMGGLARFTGMFTAGVAGTEQMIGLADTEGTGASHKNGYAVGYDGVNFAFLRYQNDTLFATHQADWNIDKMDGTGPSGMILNPTKLNVYFIQFQYLGGGAQKLYIEDDSTGDMVLAHVSLYANLNTVPSIYNPNFHLMVHALNGATTSDIVIKSASMAYFIEGETRYTETHQPQQTSGTKIGTGITTETALFTIRNKALYASKDNFIDIVLESLSASIEASAANNLGTVRLVRNATLGGTPSYSDINTTDSVIDIDVAGTTVTGGMELIPLQLAGKNDRDIVNLTAFDIVLAPGETLTVAASSVASATFRGSLLWKELF